MRRLLSLRRAGVLRLVLLAAALGVAAASALVPEPGDDTPGGPETLQPDGGAVAVHALAPDPVGGPDWGVRVYTSVAGWTCPEAGRVDDGTFGAVDENGDLQELTVQASGACSDLGDDPGEVAFAVNRYAAREGQGARTVLFGVASDGVASLTYRVSGEDDEPIETAPDGSFLVVVAGVEPTGAELAVTGTDDETTTYPLDPQ
jgi:hypothetical protein